MRLLGLSWGQLLLLGALPVVTVVVLYAVRLQARRQPVGYVDLWRRVATRAMRRGGLRTLDSFLSVFLQLAVIALLLFALGRPRLGGQSKEGTQVVFVLDTSASMHALEGRRERFELARARLLRRISDLADLDEAALITTCPPEVVVPFSRTRTIIGEAVRRAHAIDGSGHLQEAMQLGRSMLEARHAAQPDAPGGIVLLTDGSEAMPPGDSTPVDVSLVGSATENLGITVLGARADPDNPTRARVLVEVGNFGKKHARAELRLSIDGLLLDVVPLDLKPGERLEKLISDVEASDSGRLVARLEKIAIADGAADALPADDVAYAVLPRRGEIKVGLLSARDDFLYHALAANPHYRVKRIDRAKLDQAAAEGVVVLEGELPQKLPPGGYVVFGPKGGDLPFRALGDLTQPSFTSWRDDHPVLRSVELADVAVERSSRVQLGTGSTALASYLDEPLLWSVDDGRRRAVVVGFDPADSNLPLRSSFPILIYNAVSWVGAEHASTPRLEIGQPTRVPAGETVMGPEGPLAVEKRAGELRVTPERAGFYTAGDELWAASLLDGGESAIAPGPLEPQSGPRLKSARLRDREAWGPLLLLALLLLCLEWWTYHRRVTT